MKPTARHVNAQHFWRHGQTFGVPPERLLHRVGALVDSEQSRDVEPGEDERSGEAASAPPTGVRGQRHPIEGIDPRGSSHSGVDRGRALNPHGPTRLALTRKRWDDTVESMNASPELIAQDPPAESAPWLLLIHQLPPKPDYLRVKMRRRLFRLGAVQLKSTVYLLRNGPESLEDFTWLAREIHASRGTAMVCEARFVEGVGDEEIEAMLETEVRADRDLAAGGATERVEPGRTWVTREGCPRRPDGERVVDSPFP